MTSATIDSTYHSVTEPAASDAAQDESTSFANVLAGVDGSPTGRDAIALGAMLRHPDGELMLAHVSVTSSAAYLSFGTGTARAGSIDMLERARTQAAVVADLKDVASLSVGRGLHQLAEGSAADLLVVGSCSRGLLGRVFIGNDTRASLNGAPCAVAVAPRGYAEQPASINTIGVAYNGTTEAEAALAVARDLAARYGAATRALTVVSPVPGGIDYWEAFDADWGAIEATERTAKERLRSLDGVAGSVAVGVPSEALAVFGAEVDLIVIGSRGYGPVRRMMLGSTSLHLARTARAPLLVLHRPAAATNDQAS
ncbi:MAG: universal stress protein [Solirubrobacteraceae bacterium]